MNTKKLKDEILKLKNIEVLHLWDFDFLVKEIENIKKLEMQKKCFTKSISFNRIFK